MKIGILALQGAVAEHMHAIARAGAEAIMIKKTDQLDQIDGLIIPGGESTTIGRLMHQYNFIEAITAFSHAKKPIFGTCAGLIILSSHLQNQSTIHLSLMDITVERNAFGRQVDSFESLLAVKGIADPVKAIFIRAPLIKNVGNDVEVLATFQNEIVAARQDHLLATSFHPELTDDIQMHQFFIRMIRNSASCT